MLSKVSNRFLAVTILAIFVIALVGIISNKSLEKVKTASTEVTKESQTQQVAATNTLKGYLQILVMDSKTGTPVDGAKVVFSNLEQPYTTGKDGKTPIITMDISNSPKNTVTSQPYNEVVIGVFKDGYADYILFNAKVKPTSQDKPQLKTVRIVKAATPTSTPVFAMEKYSSEMAKEIVDKMKAKLNSTISDTQQIEEIDISE